MYFYDIRRLLLYYCLHAAKELKMALRKSCIKAVEIIIGKAYDITFGQPE